MTKENISTSDGVSIEEIDSQPLKNLEKNQTFFKDGFVKFQPSGQVLPRGFASIQKELYDFTVREDDVWVSSFPKCGTTWMQELVWNIANNLDFATAKSVDLEQRVPFLELSGILGASFTQLIKGPFTNSMELADIVPSPRVLKTHLSVDMLPHQIMEKNAKLIYVARNPRDTCVSFYHHWKIMAEYSGSWDDFFDAFVGDVCGYHTPFLKHVLGYWDQRDKQNVLFVTYEEMKKDLPSVIKKVAGFIKKDLNEEQIRELASHLSFKSMKDNKAVNKEDFLAAQEKITGVELGNFMRSGKVGDWRTYFTEEQLKRMESWEEINLEGTGLKFFYD